MAKCPGCWIPEKGCFCSSMYKGCLVLRSYRRYEIEQNLGEEDRDELETTHGTWNGSQNEEMEGSITSSYKDELETTSVNLRGSQNAEMEGSITRSLAEQGLRTLTVKKNESRNLMIATIGAFSGFLLCLYQILKCGWRISSPSERW